MPVFVFITDEKTRDEINIVKKHAEENIFFYSELLRMVMGLDEQSESDIARHTIKVPVGYYFVYTIEEQMEDNGDKIIIRHLSARRTDGSLPGMYEVSYVMKRLGFTNHLEECHVKKTGKNVIHVIEPYAK